MTEVFCELPKAGLGNQLFPLMRALVFADINRWPVYVSHYNQFSIGPYLRGEQNKRKYRHFFRFQRSLLNDWSNRRRLKRQVSPVINPAVEKIGANPAGSYLFNGFPDWADLFAGLRPHRQRVIALLKENLVPEQLEALDALPAPTIGLHVRLGDFKKISAGTENAGATRTAEDYFVEVVHQLRSVLGEKADVAIFTDGYADELPLLANLPYTRIITGNSDIVDLLLLSRCSVIVTSAGSTFSYWSGFLSGAPIILHPSVAVQQIRGKEAGYEGVLNLSDSQLSLALADVLRNREKQE